MIASGDLSADEVVVALPSPACPPEPVNVPVSPVSSAVVVFFGTLIGSTTPSLVVVCAEPVLPSEDADGSVSCDELLLVVFSGNGTGNTPSLLELLVELAACRLDDSPA